MAETDRIEKKHKKAKETLALQKDEASISFYLHASLFLFFLTSYAFLLFLYKNKYPLILDNEILPEILFACFGLLIFSFLSLFLLSFWRFLARVFISVIAGGIVAYILGLIYPFNIGNYFAHYVSFLPQNTLVFIAENGNLIIAVVATVLFFIMLNIFKGGAMAFLSLPVLVALFILLNTAANQTFPETKHQSVSINDDQTQETENLIYLILADHTGYGIAVENWQLLNSKSVNPVDLPFSPSFISAFYQTNNFTFYPSAYLRFQDKYRNIGSVLNPSLTEISNDLFNRDDAAYYVSSDDAQVFTTKNELFKELKKQGYHLNIYQTYPFDFCKGDSEKEIASCNTYPAPMGALYQTNMTTTSRLMLLIGHWLYSTPFGKNTAAFIYDHLKNTVNPSQVPFVGNPLSLSLPIGQAQVLAHLRKDVLSAKGKNVFFAHLNLPHYPYVYDQNCQLKLDPMTWRSNVPYTDKKENDGELKRWEDYNQQLFCTYGQINYLIKELKAANLLDKTTIVIHGDKGANIQKETADTLELTRVDKTINRFKNNMTTVFGIYKPQQKKAEINQNPCDIATLISQQILGNPSAACQTPDMTSFTQEEQEKSLAWLSSPIADNYLTKHNFEPLYASWLEKGGQAFIAATDERLNQIHNIPEEKIHFVAPPTFLKTEQEKNLKENSLQEEEKTTDFFPVPEKKALEEKTELKQEQKEPVNEKSASDVQEAQDNTDQISLEKEEPDNSIKNEDVIDEDFSELPSPIILPEIDSTVEEKWKTTDIKEGQKTTLELLPEFLNNENQNKSETESIQEKTTVQDHPSPQSSPVASVEVLPLPELEIVETVEVATEKSKTEMPSSEGTDIGQQPLEQKMNADTDIAEIESSKTGIQSEQKNETKVEKKVEPKAETKVEEKAEPKAETTVEEKAAPTTETKVEEKVEPITETTVEEKAEPKTEMKVEEKAEPKAETKVEEKAEPKAETKVEEKEKAPPLPPENADQLDIIKETVTERINADGEVETYIFIERTPNPNRFRKKESQQRVLQQDLIRVPSDRKTTEKTAKTEQPKQKTFTERTVSKTANKKEEKLLDDEDLIRESDTSLQKQTQINVNSDPKPSSVFHSPVERVLED